MIQPLQSRYFFTGLLLICVSTALTSAQVIQPLPPSLYQDAAAVPGPAIDTFVTAQAARLTKGDPAASRLAREALIGATALPGATTAFFDAYTAALDKSLVQLAENPDARVRLNAAIINAKVAAKVSNAKLIFSTVACLQSKDDAVVLWGIQAAKFMVPSLAKSTNTKMALKIDEEVANAARDHMGFEDHKPGTAIVEEAYRALTFDPTATTGSNPLEGIPPAAIEATLPTLITFMDYRVKLYSDTTPPQPLADIWGVRYLVNAAVWSKQTPTQQKDTRRIMLDLLKGVSKQIGAADAPELHEVLSSTAKAFEVIYAPSGPNHNKAIYDAAHAIAILPGNASAPSIDAKIQALDAAVSSNP